MTITVEILEKLEKKVLNSVQAQDSDITDCLIRYDINENEEIFFLDFLFYSENVEKKNKVDILNLIIDDLINYGLKDKEISISFLEVEKN